MPASSDKAQDRQSGRRLFEHAIQGRIGCWPVCDLEFPDPALQWHFRLFVGFHDGGWRPKPTNDSLPARNRGADQKKACSFEQIDKLF
jgi:hypothetical protein